MTITDNKINIKKVNSGFYCAVVMILILRRRLTAGRRSGGGNWPTGAIPAYREELFVTFHKRRTESCCACN